MIDEYKLTFYYNSILPELQMNVIRIARALTLQKNTPDATQEGSLFFIIKVRR